MYTKPPILVVRIEPLKHFKLTHNSPELFQLWVRYLFHAPPSEIHTTFQATYGYVFKHGEPLSLFYPCKVSQSSPSISVPERSCTSNSRSVIMHFRIIAMYSGCRKILITSLSLFITEMIGMVVILVFASSTIHGTHCQKVYSVFLQRFAVFTSSFSRTPADTRPLFLYC